MKNSRIDSLQILRALAFLEIFLGHCGIDCFSGSFGVSVFTVLSGFCMAVNHLPKADSISLTPVNSVKYGVAKVKKLYGLHLIMLLIIYIIVGMPTSQNAMKSLAADILLLKCWRPYSEHYYSYNGVAWYLSMYMFLCMLSPYVMRLLSKIRKKRQIYGMAGAVYGVMLAVGFYVSIVRFDIGDGFAKWFTYICPIYRVLDFSLGAMLGWLYLCPDKRESTGTGIWTFLELLTFMGVILFEFMYPTVKTNYTGIGYTAFWTPISLLLVIVFARNRGILTGLLNNRMLLWLGNLSGSAFLVHQVAIRWIQMNLDGEMVGGFYLPVVILGSAFFTIAGAETYVHLQKWIGKRK